MCNNFYLNLIYSIVYLCVLIVFSLHRESLKLILVDEPLFPRWFYHMHDYHKSLRECPVE
jgi:hypothetical protein